MDLLTSKKFQVLVGGLVATILIALIPALEPLEQYITEIVAVVIAYLVGQGLADFGKEKAVVEAESAEAQAEAVIQRYSRKE